MAEKVAVAAILVIAKDRRKSRRKVWVPWDNKGCLLKLLFIFYRSKKGFQDDDLSQLMVHGDFFFYNIDITELSTMSIYSSHAATVKKN